MRVAFEPLGERACLLTLGHGIDAAVNARVHALAAALRRADIPDTEDIVPAYASLLLRHGLVEPGAAKRWLARVRDIAATLPDDAGLDDCRCHDIAVCYDGADLAHVATSRGLSTRELVERHTAPDYRVAMIGFSPGFPYLVGMDPRLATARRPTPRTRVPAGSVAIGGSQTGIYPRELPGGWQLVGRTATRLFDAADEARPCLLAPGDRVRLHAVVSLDDTREASC